MTAPYFTLLHEGGFATGATRYSDTFGHRSCINVSVSIAGMTISAILDTGAEWCIIDPEPVSYTHLDVYKRQYQHSSKNIHCIRQESVFLPAMKSLILAQDERWRRA